MIKILHFVAAGVVAGALALAIPQPTAAWHPEGVIKKYVQNQTTGTVKSDAETAADAVSAKPGDTLKYIITVSNVGKPDSRGHNDMVKTVMTDTLPAGVELVSNPSQRTISENLGTLKPGAQVTKEYVVRVTSKTDGAVIKNQACFTGDSEVNDAPQADCDDAFVKVKVPPVVPEEPKTPVEPPKQETPQVLPSTGPEALISGVAGAGALAYSAQAYLRSKRELNKR